MIAPQVYDIELFPNCFTVTFCSVFDEKDYRSFVVHEEWNDLESLLDFLDQPGLKLVGYNNVGYDYPVLHLFKIHPREWYRKTKLHRILQMLNDKSYQIVNNDEGPYKFVVHKPFIPQRDVFLIWHFDNAAKRTSLKWVQCSTRWPNIAESPLDFNQEVSYSDIGMILLYNLNDVLSTRAFYLRSKEKIDIRYVLSEKFGLNLLNANDPKIGEMIILKRLADLKGMTMQELKTFSTTDRTVVVNDCLLPYIKFNSRIFQGIHEKFKRMIVIDTRKTEEMTVLYDGMTYEFGFGGLHAARGGEVFEDVDSADVSSYYPNLSIKNGWYPRHLGPDFCTVYEGIYEERKLYPKKTPENEGLKLALNGVFGKSNSEWSFLFDPKFTMQITLNGQLLLAMLCERITEEGAGRVIMANTDGIEVLVKDRAKYDLIMKEWQVMTKLELEFAHYKKLAIRDVNNYIAVLDNGKTKEKGAFEVDKEINKDPSMRIVALAVREHFKTGVPVSRIIAAHTDMWDFFMYQRAKTGAFFYRTVDDEGELVTKKAPKTIRYYITHRGTVLVKKTDKKFEKVHQSEWVQPCNEVDDTVFEEMQSKLDRAFYVREANKLLNGVQKAKLSLF